MSRIEDEAEMLFRSIFYETRKLEPAFKTGEKGPITDGHIDIYRSMYNTQTDHSLRDGSFIGRLPVQIKGKFAHKNRKLKSFKLDRSELENIIKIGGLVLLVASIDRKSHRPIDPYFADLTGANCEHFLAQMSRTQTKKSVPIKPFPTAPDEVVEYVNHLHRKYRVSLPRKPNGEDMRDLENLKVTLPYEIDWSRPQLFGGPGSSAILETIDTFRDTQAIDAILQVIPADYTLSSADSLTISCGGVQFDSCRRRRISTHTVEFYISPGIRLTLGRENQKNVRLRFQESLHDVIKDQRFLAGALNGEWIEANGERWLQLGNPAKAIENFTKPLPYLQDLERFCEVFGVDPRLFKVGDLPHEDLENIKKVVLCLFYEADFDNKQGIPLRQSLKVNGDAIEILWSFDEEVQRWVPTSFFDTSKFWCRAPLNGTDSSVDEPIYELVTPFEFFSAEDLTGVLNLNPEHLVSSYRRIESDRARELAQVTVSKLIAAADLRIDRRREFLSMALALCEWLRTYDPEDKFLILDQMQIKKRLGYINVDDGEYLRRLWKAAGDKRLGAYSLQIEAAASILLGKFEGLEYLLEKMEDGERSAFEAEPIFYLKSNPNYEVGVPDNRAEWQKIESEIDREDFDRIARFWLGKKTSYEHH